jgi:hypothetical protein
MQFCISFSREKRYTEEGMAVVEAHTREAALVRALEMVRRGEVEFQMDAAATDEVAGTLRVTSVSTT